MRQWWRQSSEIKKWEAAGFLVYSILGTLLHFVYEWSGGQPAAGLIGPVNESVWEHLKLLFMPVFFYSLIEAWKGPQIPGLLWIKFKAMLLGMAFILVSFYTLTGLAGRNIDWLNIVIFFAAALLVARYTVKASLREISPEDGGEDRKAEGRNWLGLILFLGLFILFAWFTAAPPKLPVFIPPSTISS